MWRKTLASGLALGFWALSPVHGFIPLLSQVGRSGWWSSLGSSRSPYETVSSSGTSWNGRYWEGGTTSWDQKFKESRDRQRRRAQGQFPREEDRFDGPRPRYERQYSRDQELLGYNTQNRNKYSQDSFPLQRERAPLVRYSDLSQEEQEAVTDPRRTTFPQEFRSPQSYGPWTQQDDYGRSVPRPREALEIQGGSQSTWSTDPNRRYEQGRVRVSLESPDSRPLQADVEVWQGPGNIPQKMRIYTEDGRLRPFTTHIETPGGSTTHSIHVKNTGPLEFPLVAGIEKTFEGLQMPQSMADDYNSARQYASHMGRRQEIHGGNLRTYSFDPSVASVEVEIFSEGLPINAVVELWQGPGDVKTIAKIYSDDGINKPFSAILETPGSGNTIAIKNVGPEAYPIQAKLNVYRANDAAYSYDYNPNSRFYGTGNRRWYD